MQSPLETFCNNLLSSFLLHKTFLWRFFKIYGSIWCSLVAGSLPGRALCALRLLGQDSASLGSGCGQDHPPLWGSQKGLLLSRFRRALPSVPWDSRGLAAIDRWLYQTFFSLLFFWYQEDIFLDFICGKFTVVRLNGLVSSKWATSLLSIGSVEIIVSGNVYRFSYSYW